MTDHAVCNPASDPVIYPYLMHAASSCGELLMIGEVTLLLDRLTINGDASVTDLEVTLALGAVGGGMTVKGCPAAITVSGFTGSGNSTTACRNSSTGVL
jgi:hypothetical protein